MEYYTLASNFYYVNKSFKYYSQNYETGEMGIDKVILEKYITFWKNENRKNEDVEGVFLELGGYDGVTYSNTKTLEDSLKFTGVLIEASPISFNKMCKTRPNCKNHNYAVSNIDKEYVSFLGGRVQSPLGGLKHILENLTQSSGRNWIDAWNISREEINVKVKKLSNILEDDNIKYIDVFSLDVQGAELEVLESMDWNIPVYLIIFETSAWGKEGKEMVNKCRNLLSSKGFILDYKTSLDEFWINNNYFRKNFLK